jgi:hypothetical protein
MSRAVLSFTSLGLLVLAVWKHERPHQIISPVETTSENLTD